MAAAIVSVAAIARVTVAAAHRVKYERKALRSGGMKWRGEGSSGKKAALQNELVYECLAWCGPVPKCFDAFRFFEPSTTKTTATNERTTSAIFRRKSLIPLVVALVVAVSAAGRDPSSRRTTNSGSSSATLFTHDPGDQPADALAMIV